MTIKLYTLETIIEQSLYIVVITRMVAIIEYKAEVEPRSNISIRLPPEWNALKLH